LNVKKKMHDTVRGVLVSLRLAHPLSIEKRKRVELFQVVRRA